MQGPVISMGPRMRIEDPIRPATAQLLKREIGSAAQVERLDDRLGMSAKADRFAVWLRHRFRRSEKHGSAKGSNELAAQLWGSMVVTYEIGQELTQILIF